MYIRQKTIREALDDTCNWLFSTIEYHEWISRQNIADHRGLLWIKGKPGAGKSTLMKEAFRRAEALNSNSGTTTACFFFNARGTEQLEKTPLGLYRSILHQVLQQDLKALSFFVPKYIRKVETEGQVAWHEEDLQKFLLLTYATSDSKPAFIFVDALDECDEDEVRQLVDFFRYLTTKAWSAGAQLNICLSSRHYPHISIEKCPEVFVERYNEQDILTYIESEASQMGTISQLQGNISQRSQGVFLWAVLAVSMLKRFGHGKSLKWMEKKLQEIPPELDTLFRKLFTHIDSEDASKAIALFRWILFAEERLKLSQLHCAIGFTGNHPFQSIQSWEDSEHFLPSSRRVEMITTLSRGLVEAFVQTSDEGNAKDLVDTRDHLLQFIHESVRDFFLKGNGFSMLDAAIGGSVVGNGHASIALTCLNYLQTSEIKEAARRNQVGLSKQFILLNYAGTHLFTHIEAAEQEGVSQKALLHRLASNSNELCRRLQKIFSGGAAHYKNRSLDGAINQDEEIHESGETLLYHCSRRSLAATASRLIQIGESPNEPTKTEFRYPIIAAVSTFCPNEATEATVRLLLSNRAITTSRNNWGLTALHVAAFRSTLGVVAMLLKHGADTKAIDVDHDTPLHRAPRIREDSVKIMQMLVESGAELDARNKFGKTPLHVAVEREDVEGVKWLVRAGCRLDVRDNRGKTALDTLNGRNTRPLLSEILGESGRI
jgi:hypothetical protein